MPVAEVSRGRRQARRRPAGVEKLCAQCGDSFRDPTKNRSRTYCLACRPIEVKGRPELRVVSRSERVRGRPFTVAHFRRWAERLKLKTGIRFELERYQELVLRDLFARRRGGRPRFSEVWLVIPEGNGKTTFVALVVLYTIEHKPESWVPVAASARDQAVDLTYRIAAGFLERNRLDSKSGGPFRLHPGYRQIVHGESKGALKIFASDAASGDGVDPDLAVIEELHRLATMELYETWAGKLVKSGGQLLIPTTAGEPGGAFEEMRDRLRHGATKVTRRGGYVRAEGPGTVLHEYALPAKADPDDFEAVKAANPFSVITVESLEEKRSKPSYRRAHWLRFTCNRPTRDESAAIGELEWEQAADAGAAPPEGAPIWCGLDLGWKWDTTAITPLWLESLEDRLLFGTRILEPPRDHTSLSPDVVKRALRDVHARNPIHTLVMDMTNGTEIAAWAEDELGCRVVDRGTGLTAQVVDFAAFTEALRMGWLRHDGDPTLAKHVLNAIARALPGGDFIFARPKEGRNVGSVLARQRVIDGLVAAAMVNTVAGENSDSGFEAFTEEQIEAEMRRLEQEDAAA